MERARRIWNWRLSREQWRTVQVRSLRLLGLFLALMLCCTLISQAADNLTTARVSVTRPQRQAIVHVVKAYGRLEVTGQIPVTAPSDTLVQSVAVHEGDQVEAGDLLFTFDTGELQMQLRQKQLELQRLQLELQAQREADALKAEESELKVERAKEDYGLLEESTNLTVNDAKDAAEEARREMQDYDREDDNEDAESAYRSLRAAYRAKLRALDQAIAQREAELIRAEREIADAGKTQPGAQADLIAVDIQLKGLEITRLQEQLATGGQVYAPADGLVTSLAVKAGGRTGSEAAAYLSGEGGLRFSARITEDERKYVDRGGSVNLSLSGDTRSVTGLTVGNLKPVAGEDGFFQLQVELPESTGAPDQSATAEILQRSGAFDLCLPLSALHSDGQTAYVLVLRETETTLGLTHTVERVDVTVEEQNESQAAVTGPISGQDQVVISSDRGLLPGDRVRLLDGGV